MARNTNTEPGSVAGSDPDSVRIGRQIRDLRKAKGITQTYIAEKIGRSVGYVSQIERGISSLPIPVLQAIGELLEVPITWFFHTETQQNDDELNYVVRSSSRRHLEFSGTGISEELLSPWLSGGIVMILTTFAPGAGSDQKPRKRKGEEAGFVQSGSLELTIGNKSFVLNPGDSFSITGDEPHFVKNPSETENAVILWVMTPATY